MMVILLQCLKNGFIAKITNHNQNCFHSNNVTFSYQGMLHRYARLHESGKKDNLTKNLSIIYNGLDCTPSIVCERKTKESYEEK